MASGLEELLEDTLADGVVVSGPEVELQIQWVFLLF